jgi:hypothetical protein
MGRDVSEELGKVGVVEVLVTAGHNGGANEGALLATGDAHAKEVDALLGIVIHATLGVLVVRVASVDNDVAGLKVREKLVGNGIHDGTGLDHEDDLARSLEGIAERLEVVGVAHELHAVLVTLNAVLHELLRCLAVPVEDRNGVPLAGDVQGEALSHDAHAKDPNVATHIAPLVGKTWLRDDKHYDAISTNFFLFSIDGEIFFVNVVSGVFCYDIDGTIAVGSM